MNHSVLIRNAILADALSIADITQKGWNEEYTGLMAQSTLDSMTLDKREKAWFKILSSPESNVIVAEINEQVVGFSSFGPSRFDNYGKGEIYALYALKIFQNQGIGRRLLDESLQRLQSEKLNPYVVLCLQGNTSGSTFYERAGFEAQGDLLEEIDGLTYKNLAYVKARKHEDVLWA